MYCNLWWIAMIAIIDLTDKLRLIELHKAIIHMLQHFKMYDEIDYECMNLYRKTFRYLKKYSQKSATGIDYMNDDDFYVFCTTNTDYDILQYISFLMSDIDIKSLQKKLLNDIPHKIRAISILAFMYAYKMSIAHNTVKHLVGYPAYDEMENLLNSNYWNNSNILTNHDSFKKDVMVMDKPFGIRYGKYYIVTEKTDYVLVNNPVSKLSYFVDSKVYNIRHTKTIAPNICNYVIYDSLHDVKTPIICN